MIKSSANGCSRSCTTKGLFLIFSLWRSSSSSLNGFPWKSSTRHTGVSRCKCWSRAKRRLPRKFRNTSWYPCVSTETFFPHTRKKNWLGISAASDGPVVKNRPSSVAAYTFFMRNVFLDRTFRRPLLPSVLSPLVSDVSTLCWLWDSPCYSLSSTSFSSVNRKTYIIQTQNCSTQLRRKLLTIHQGRQHLCFLLLTNGVTQSHHLMLSCTIYSGSRIGDKLIWKARNVVKIWSQHGSILVNSSFEHKKYHHQTPAPTTPGSDLDNEQPQGHHAGPLSQRYQAFGNNYLTAPELPISLHADRHTFISENSRNHLGITCKQTENEPLVSPKPAM